MNPGVRDVTIDRMTQTDLPACLELLRELHRGDIGGGMAGCLAEFASSPNALVLVARKETRIVGLIAGTHVPDLDFEGHAASINAIFVAGSSRGTGIGRLLLSAFIDWARQQGCAAVLASTNRQGARRFFCRNAFSTREGMSIVVLYPVPSEDATR